MAETYDVNHPELAVVTHATIIVAKPMPDADDLIGEGFHLVSVLHINNIEVLPSTTASNKA